LFFFFSSRRRHTRFSRDWSSDVCSSDLDRDGNGADLVGLLPGRAVMQKKLAALALQDVELPEGRLRGHTFHHSVLDCALEPLALGECPNYRQIGRAHV